MTLLTRARRITHLALLVGLVIPLGILNTPRSTISVQADIFTPSPTPTTTPSPTVTATTPNASPTATQTSTLTATSSLTPTETSTVATTLNSTSTKTATTTTTSTITGTYLHTPTSTITTTPTPTPTSTPLLALFKLPAPFPSGSVLINEIAWAGTLASAYDEWIELHNPGPDEVDLSGWTLTDGADIHVPLNGSIPGYGFYLLERTDDTTVADIPADLIYTGGLNNSGESLLLLDPMGNSVDSAGGSGGWPAGDAATRASMERIGGADIASNWATYSGTGGNGHDANGNPIPGTPRQTNSVVSSAPTATPTPPSTPSPPLWVLINEIAWSGTEASASDEWIELHNPGLEDIDLTGWILTDGGDINVTLSGTIAAQSFYLLERTDESTVADISADLIYTGSLSNSGETLWLLDPTDAIVDSANSHGGKWPAGSSISDASMERRGGADMPDNWDTFTGYYGVGHDAAGNHIDGTPRSINSLFFPIPVPTCIPGRVVINEVLIRPHYDWNGDGEADLNDEFIELYNRGPYAVDLRGWKLDDISGSGSKPHTLPDVTIEPRSYAVFFRTRTHITLNDSGDRARLLAPDGRLIDKISYLKVRAYNLSYGRLPDGSRHLFYGLWPTPGGRNVLFVETLPEPEPLITIRPIMRLSRLGRHPMTVCWMHSLGNLFLPPEFIRDDR